mmetsp:Transcript_5722/g.9486  ORF Transcript_5722/g.9486 Transcript_5722/m.9486 type:complete len:101 (+) Transcript_5722:1527-1829(+)
MSRGDQRDRDRQKALKKLETKNKQNSCGGDPSSRNLSDKEALDAKVKAKQALKEQQALEEEHNPSKPPPKPKKKAPAPASFDLLNAGLAGTKTTKRGSRK